MLQNAMPILQVRLPPTENKTKKIVLNISPFIYEEIVIHIVMKDRLGFRVKNILNEFGYEP